jgi:hypothetical protein
VNVDGAENGEVVAPEQLDGLVTVLELVRFGAARTSDAGLVLVAPLGSSHLTVGVTDLAGRPLHHHQGPADRAAGPECEAAGAKGSP